MNREAVCGYLLTISLIATGGCSSQEPHREPAVAPPSSQPALAESRDETIKTNALSEPDPQLPEGSGETTWPKRFRGMLIVGVDGELYEPYDPTAIERVQLALKKRDLYAGPINGVLDASTMRAIYGFQQATFSLQLCGVPTPRTRWMLEQGSHTDPAISLQ